MSPISQKQSYNPINVYLCICSINLKFYLTGNPVQYAVYVHLPHFSQSHVGKTTRNLYIYCNCKMVPVCSVSRLLFSVNVLLHFLCNVVKVGNAVLICYHSTLLSLRLPLGPPRDTSFSGRECKHCSPPFLLQHGKWSLLCGKRASCLACLQVALLHSSSFPLLTRNS